MFKIGGTPNEGIMHGLVKRQGYALGDRVEEITTAMDKYAPIPKSRFPIGSIGLNLVSGEYAGDGLLKNIARSARGPYEQFVQADDARQQALAKRKASAVGVAVSEDAQMRMQMLKNMKEKAQHGAIWKDAQDLITAGFYPDTPEGLKDAMTEATRLRETSPGKPMQDQWNDIYRTESSDTMLEPGVAENRADWVVYIRPNIPAKKRGGPVPTLTVGKGANAVDEVNPEAMEPGKVYWDEQTGTLFEVIENEEGLKKAREVPNWRNDYFKN